MEAWNYYNSKARICVIRFALTPLVYSFTFVLMWERLSKTIEHFLMRQLSNKMKMPTNQHGARVSSSIRNGNEIAR